MKKIIAFIAMLVLAISLTSLMSGRGHRRALKRCYKKVSRIYRRNLRKCRRYRTARFRKACRKSASRRFMRGRKACRRRYRR